MATLKQSEAYVAQLTTINEEIVSTIAACTEADWRRVCAGEKRTVGVVAHHIATVEGTFVGFLQAFRAGEHGAPNISPEAVDQMNAEHAAAFATVGKPETLDLLRQNGTALTDLLAALDDAQLAQVAGVFGGHELRVEQVVEWVLIGHFQEHLASIRATFAA